jgi:hypothetical protein
MANVQAQAQPQAGGAKVMFVLTPGQASRNNLLDYYTTDGIKQFQIAISSLYTGDDQDKFNCNSTGSRDFLQLLETHSKEKPAWMMQEPSNKNAAKKVEGKEYWWCHKHKSWTHHKASECKGKGFIPRKAEKQNEGKKRSESQHELKLAKAAESLHEESDE